MVAANPKLIMTSVQITREPPEANPFKLNADSSQLT